MRQRPDPEKPASAGSVSAVDAAGALERARSSGGAWKSWRAAAAPARIVPDIEFPDPAGRMARRAQPPRVPALHGGLAGPGGHRAAALSSRPSRSCRTCEAPEQIVPGKPLFFATAVPIDGFACGVLVESQMGRPTKIEGNPDHPASLGATDAFAQADVLSLYDPDRSQVVTHNGRVETWEHFQTLLLSAFANELREDEGRRPAHPDPDGHLADAGRPAPAAARAVPRGEVAWLRADHARRRSGRLPAGFRRRARAGLSSGQGRRDRRRSTPTFWPGARAGSRMRGRSPTREPRGPAHRPPSRAAPPMNRLYVDRVHADAHRRRGRSPAGRRGARRRRRRPGHRRVRSGSASRRARRSDAPGSARRHTPPGSPRWRAT